MKPKSYHWEGQPRKTENEFSYDRLTMIQPRIGRSRIRVRVNIGGSVRLRFRVSVIGLGFVLVVYSAGQNIVAHFSGRTRSYLVPNSFSVLRGCPSRR